MSALIPPQYLKQLHQFHQLMGGLPLHFYLAVPVLMLASYFLVPYFQLSYLRKYPGPRTAALSRLWLARASRNGVRSIKVHEEHMKNGGQTFVRIGPTE